MLPALFKCKFSIEEDKASLVETFIFLDFIIVFIRITR